MLYIYPDVGIGEVDLTALGLIHSRIHTSLLPSLVPPKAADINLPGAFLNMVDARHCANGGFLYISSSLTFCSEICSLQPVMAFLPFYLTVILRILDKDIKIKTPFLS